MPTPRSKEPETIQIQPVDIERLSVCVLGESPYICNRMSEKARQTLLLPAGRPTTAERASRLKHNPVEEFRASPYILSDPTAPTLIATMSSAFKGAIATAALDLPGARKAQIGRLVRVEGEYTPLYGNPFLKMDVTRSADIDRTPDIRTRMALVDWCAIVQISFVSPLLNATSVLNLLNAGGVTAGVGDWRTEKGKGSFGGFTVVQPDDPEFVRRVREFGRAFQQDRLDNPVSYDRETDGMLEWFAAEVKKRGKSLAVAA